MKSMHLLLIALSFTSFLALNANAVGFLEFRDDEFKAESVKEKKWLFNIGMEYLQYPTTLPEFKGEHESIKDGENYNVYGLSLGFGREFSLFGNFSTSLKLGGFYAKTMGESVGKASEELDLDLSNVRSDHLVYGGEASASLNYLVENSVLNFQPFFEFGAGTGIANIEKEYVFEGIQGDRSDAENYDISVDENFNYTRASLGVNFISLKGIVSYVKVTQMFMGLSKRKTKGNDGSSNIDEEDEAPDSKNLLAASIGFGYLF